MVLIRVVSKALGSIPSNIKYICLYVCASVTDGSV